MTAAFRVRVLPRVLPIDGRVIGLQATATYIQWRYEATDTAAATDWVNLVALADITGPEGPNVELRNDGANIQWRAEGDVSWNNLVALVDITGDNGLDGTDAGILYSFDDGTTDADPGAGNIRFNNADLSAATEAYVSDVTRGGTDIESVLLSVAGTNRLTITSGNTQIVYSVASVTDATNYVKFGLTGHAGVTSLADGAPLAIQFAGTGDLLSANNLSDVADPDAALDNLESGEAGKAILRDAGLTRATAAAYSPVTAPAYIRTAGYYAVGDLGDALYKLGGSNVDLTITLDDASTQDYELAERGIDIRKLGAKASGSDSDATANANAINEALDRTGVAIVDQTALGFHIGDDTFALDDNQFIICPHGKGKLIGAHGAGENMITMSGYEQYKGVRGIHFDMENANATSTAIEYLTGSEIVFKTMVEDCFFHACGTAIGQSSANYDTGESIWKNCKSEYARGTQFYSAASNGFLFLKNVNVDLTKAHTGQYAHDWTAIQIERFIGLSLDEVAVTGQGFAHLAGTVYNANAKGIIIDGVDSATRRYVWMPGFVRVEAAQGDSIHVKRSVFDKGVGSVESFAGLGTGVYYYQMSFVQQAQMLARGANDYVGAPAGADAFVFEECTDSIITALVAGSATGNGVKVKNCARMTFVAPLTTGNTGYGIESEGTSDAITIIEHQSISDGAPSLLVGPSSVIRGQTVDGVRRINDYNAVTVYNGSGASPSTSFAKLPLNTVLAGNYAGKWDTTNSQITNLVGPARFAGQVYFSAGAVDQQPLEVALYRDGALYQHAWTIASGTGGHMVPFSFTVPSVAANVWDLRVKSATAGTIPTNASYTFMTVDLL